MTIYWSNTHNIWFFCCYSICLFCWYIIHNNYNFITLSHWSISNTFSILTILLNICGKIPTLIFFAFRIIFTFPLTCFIIPFLFWITRCTIEFTFAITLNMFSHCFSFIFIYYHIKYSNICDFCFFWDTYFWR